VRGAAPIRVPVLRHLRVRLLESSRERWSRSAGTPTCRATTCRAPTCRATTGLPIVLAVVGVLVALGVIGTLARSPGTAGESPSAAADVDTTPTPRPTATARPSPTATSLALRPLPSTSLSANAWPTRPLQRRFPSPTSFQRTEWALIMRSPDDYFGSHYQVWACITRSTRPPAPTPSAARPVQE
jgi:hypothetical protein